MRDVSRRDASVDRLRRRWQERSIDSGWSFPTDWYTPAVDALCEALCWRTDAAQPAARRLGGDRAAAGVPLAEALVDIDQLAGLAPRCDEDLLRRAVSLGWADRHAVAADAVLDPITGLASRDYLQVRLDEVYRAARARGSDVTASHALVVIRLERGDEGGFVRELPIIIVAEQVRAVFDAGQSLVQAGPCVLLVLTERLAALPRQIRLLRHLVAGNLTGEDGRDLVPRAWIEPLPPDYPAACELLSSLRR